jgi:DNA-binding transcriptional ArsR family regulator
MKDPLQPERCAELLSALAAPERLQIVRLLREGPRSVGEIAAELKMALVNASHHLGVLRHAGLVRNRKQGRHVIYSLAPNLLQEEAEGQCERLDLGCCRLELPDPKLRPKREP